MQNLKDLFFWIKWELIVSEGKENCLEQVKNLNDKRVCDQSKDGKVIVSPKEKTVLHRITANADRTLPRLRMNMQK